ncbi:uncharacterized protein LOC144575994 [Carex rostrata]
MAASVLACLTFIFFLPCFTNSCTTTLPCDPSIQIKPPFYLQSDTMKDPSCLGSLRIGCGNGFPVLLWQLLVLQFESISYNTNIIRAQDFFLSSSLKNSACGNLYFNFSSPVKFNNEMYNLLNSSLSSVRCDHPNQIQSPPKIFGKDYNLSYSPSLDEDDKSLQNCSRTYSSLAPSFEYIFSLKNDSPQLSLLSASYSDNLVARPGCFANSTEVFDFEAGKGKMVGAKKQDVLIICTTAGSLAFILACLILYLKLQSGNICAKCILSSKPRPQGNIEMLLEKYGSFAPKRYKYEELKKITKSFQDTLGKGGFGTVYRGRLQDGRLVAVKILHKSSSDIEELLNEIVSIGRTSHVNVVSLLGFCIEGSKHALIYEYMPNGSLDNYIYYENPKAVLGWEKLYEIAIGIARGLEYLHRGCNTRIVHFDIKPQNILLDEDFNPKIADFGLAKLCPPKESILSMAEMRGTIGYISPEIFSRSFGVVSTKSDVYSYGMMVLEMVGRRRNAKPDIENPSQEYFPHWLYDHLAKGNPIQSSDATIETEEIARKMGMVGLWCTQTIPANRPSMKRVMEMLERSLDELKMPPKPYMCSPNHVSIPSDTSPLCSGPTPNERNNTTYQGNTSGTKFEYSTPSISKLGRGKEQAQNQNGVSYALQSTTTPKQGWVFALLALWVDLAVYYLTHIGRMDQENEEIMLTHGRLGKVDAEMRGPRFGKINTYKYSISVSISSPKFRNSYNLISQLVPSLMAASVLACLFFVFFLLCFSNSCNTTLPCDPSIQIKPPFYLQSDAMKDPSCLRSIMIECGNGIPVLLWKISYLPLESISYDNHTITVQDPYLSSSFNKSGCGNLYFNFSSPVNNFYYDNYELLNSSFSSVRCDPLNHIKSPPKIFGKDYKLSYSPSLDDEDDKSPKNCSRPHSFLDQSFEYILSFENDSPELSLLSASYSDNLVARPGCFANSIDVFNFEDGKGKMVGAKKQDVLIICAAAGSLAFIVACLILYLKLRSSKNSAKSISRSKDRPQGNIEMLLENCGSFAPKRYKYAEVKKITGSFQHRLGKGGFGTVYRGILLDGRLVAVKILHNFSCGREELLNEVQSIDKTSHVNVVSLLGFCIEGSKHALIYEYMPNGSLDNYIYYENPKAVLGWEKLYEIAIGIARGLEYLHRGCNARIVHFDIKPQNILLDEDFNPKIADFGLAKLCPPKESILSMAEMRGTIGYISPEVFSRSFGVVSTKSDVYSYGMVVLEMVGGRRNAKPNTENPSQEYFPHWLYDRLAEGGPIQSYDATIETEEIARKMGMVGLSCTQTMPANRPSMKRVLEMLERSLVELELPPKPYLSSPPHVTILSDTSHTPSLE